MSAIIAAITDILVICALGAGVFYAIRLSRQLNEFKTDKKVLSDLITTLNIAADRAETAIKIMRKTATEGADSLQGKISQSRGLFDELEIIIQAGDSLADRLEKLAESGRRAITDPDMHAPRTTAAPQTQAQAPHTQAEPRTRSERELLDALRNRKRDGDA